MSKTFTLRPTLPAAGCEQQPTRSLWSRFMSALAASRRKAADREIARIVEFHGGKINDSLERRIEARFMRL